MAIFPLVFASFKMTPTWFAKHPKKTIILLLCLFFIGAIVVTETILAAKATLRGPKEKRFIRLREYEPFLYYDLTAKAEKTLGKSAKKYLLRVDENGFIMPSKIHANPDLTIIFLGASTTACLLMEEENRFPFLVGRLLEENLGLKVNSYNASTEGNTTLHSLDVLYNKLIPLKPDLIIMMHNINDLSTLLREGTYWNNNLEFSPLVVTKPSLVGALKELRDSLIPHTSMGVKVMLQAIFGEGEDDALRRARGLKKAIDKEDLVKEFTMNLETFIAMCRIRGIVPVLMTQQNRFKDNPDESAPEARDIEKYIGISYREYKEMYGLFNAAIRQTGGRNNVLVIDLDGKVPHEADYLYDLVHFNDKGSKLAATIIFDDLQPAITSWRRRPQR